MDLVWEEAKVGLGECKCIYDWCDWAIGGVRLIHKFDFDLTCVMEKWKWQDISAFLSPLMSPIKSLPSLTGVKTFLLIPDLQSV